MKKKSKLRIDIDIYDAACLRFVLQEAVDRVERLKHLAPDSFSQEKKDDIEKYHGKLKNCLTAVTAALPSYMSSSPESAD